MKNFYFDVETTGLDSARNAIIQLAFIIEIDGKVTDLGNIKVRPHEGAIIEDTALQIHGMTREQINKFDEPKIGMRHLIQVLDNYINKHDQSDKFTPIGYNVGFDEMFLLNFFHLHSDEFFYSYFSHEPVDPLPVLRFLRYTGHPFFSKFPNLKLATVCEQMNIKINAHDAMSDIEATRELLNKLKLSIK